MIPATFLVLVLANLFVGSEAISSVGGVGKKRNQLPEKRNRFLCPGCDRKKTLNEIESLFDSTDAVGPPGNGVWDDKVKKEISGVHCMKGDRGEKGKPGEKGENGRIDQSQIDAAVKPLKAKLEALSSSYIIEMARLKNEVQDLRSNFLRTLGSKANPAMSCKQIFEHERYSPSGTYYLNVTGVPGRITKTYCYMEENTGCPAGSTLVMKIDGSKETFRYSSPLWSNKEPYNQNDGNTLYDSKETKLPTYWSTPLSKVCIRMRVGSWNMESLVIDRRASSLYDIIADGKYRPTKGSRTIWESILRGSSLEEGCLRQGFNAHGGLGSAAARIGAIAGMKSDCSVLDSFIGVGTRGGTCGIHRNITCGNQAGCHSDNGGKYIEAFGYVFVY